MNQTFQRMRKNRLSFPSGIFFLIHQTMRAPGINNNNKPSGLRTTAHAHGSIGKG